MVILWVSILDISAYLIPEVVVLKNKPETGMSGLAWPWSKYWDKYAGAIPFCKGKKEDKLLF